MPIIEVRNLTKKYKDITAVKSISFEVQQGETFGILGPNGAGKTTTLEMIEGIRSITSGEIKVDGLDIKKSTDEVKKIIGVQLQSSSYFERLKLVELIDLFAAFYGTKVNALELLKKVGLEQKKKSYVNNLSGGQQQRFSIASTLVNNPKVVFLDEPTTGLDPQARRNIWDLVQGIKTKGETIVITTHYMEEAEYLCDRIAIMDQGKIIDLDTPRKLIKKHGTGSTISFKSNSYIDEKILKKISTVKNVKRAGSEYFLSTSDEMITMKELIEIDKKNTLNDLAVKPSTLEDVFINLTGKKLRE